MSFKVIAGDFPEGSTFDTVSGKFLIIFPGFTLKREYIELASVEMITEENKKKFMGAAGWGLVGAVALGPLGALAGILAGGNKKNVCVACQTKDGKKLLVEVDQKMYKKLVAAVF